MSDTVEVMLDKIQERLHDSGTLWPRTELLRWLNDGYRDFLARTKAFTRINAMDVPGRFTMTYLHEWETRYIDGVYWNCFLAGLNAKRACAYQWETEFLEGISPTTSLNALTQQWERTYTTESDRHFRFGFRREHLKIKRVTWDDKLISPISIRELDSTEDDWMKQGGEPIWWTTGTGRARSIEIFEIRTDYQQAYDLENFDNGMPRYFTGSRTYAISELNDISSNGYGYTTSGDAEGITQYSMSFAPNSAFTSEGDRADAPTPAYNFTINYTMNYASDEFQGKYTGTQPWEFDGVSTGRTLGMWPWERLDPDGNYENTVITAEDQISLTGFGMRFTQAASDTSDGFGVQIWEKEFLDGETEFSDGDTIGTYAWEEEFGGNEISFGFGTIRSISSPDRQYYANLFGVKPYPYVGVIKDFKGTPSNLGVYETVLPDHDLEEEDRPYLIPDQFQKYLRYFTLSRAFGRLGEGNNPGMAQHYRQRYLLGITLLDRFSDTARLDRVWGRDPVTEERGKPPRVKLPSSFERISY